MSLSPVARPTQLTLAVNDLDFYYLPARTSLDAARPVRLLCTVDCAHFFSRGAHHMVFALDCMGGQGTYNPHCGSIVRHGANLWSEARGFIVFGDGAVMAERWNGTAMPVLVPVYNRSGATFNPAIQSVVTVHIQAGYRAGPLADRMHIAIHQGITVDGPKIFEGEIAGAGWGWDWSGTHTAALAAIASGFVAPAATGCVEQLLPRSAPAARLPFVGLELGLA